MEGVSDVTTVGVSDGESLGTLVNATSVSASSMTMVEGDGLKTGASSLGNKAPMMDPLLGRREPSRLVTRLLLLLVLSSMEVTQGTDMKMEVPKKRRTAFIVTIERSVRWEGRNCLYNQMQRCLFL